MKWKIFVENKHFMFTKGLFTQFATAHIVVKIENSLFTFDIIMKTPWENEG